MISHIKAIYNILTIIIKVMIEQSSKHEDIQRLQQLDELIRDDLIPNTTSLSDELQGMMKGPDGK